MVGTAVSSSVTSFQIPAGTLAANTAYKAVLNFSAPVLEGYADPGPISWEQQLKKYASLKFTLTENR